MLRAIRGVVAIVPLALATMGCSTVGGVATTPADGGQAPATVVANAADIAPAAMSGAQRLASTRISLPARLSYLQQGYNELPEWTRVDVATAPDGAAWVAWPATNGIHVTPLTAALTRAGADTVIAGAKEVSGLIAFDNGFTVLTRVPDSNKWHETAAALISYRNGKRVFETRLTSSATDDTAPVLDGELAWNGTEYGAYFVIHGAGGPADGHFGDKLVYVSATGKLLAGGWSWGCSHNEGIALSPGTSGDFPSLCLDDWRSGLFVSTGIGAPDDAPVLQREQCWAGYCGGTFPDNAGDLVKLSNGRYAAAWASRGAVAAKKNPGDPTGRGWLVTARWNTHQVAVHFMSNATKPSGGTIYLTDDPATDHVNVHLAPYGHDELVVSWETVSHATCAAGTCTGTFTGTHVEVIDYAGKVVSPAVVIAAHISGDIAALQDGDLIWAYVAATPDDHAALSTSPGTAALWIARLRLAG